MIATNPLANKYVKKLYLKVQLYLDLIMGVSPPSVDYLSRKSYVGYGTVLAGLFLAAFIGYHMWFHNNQVVVAEVASKNVKLNSQNSVGDADNELPFEVSSTSVLFEIGAGGFVTLKPVKPFKEAVDIQVQFDDPDIIDTIGSFTVQPDSTKNIFIPLHSKNHVAGHCTMSFKASTKTPEVKNIFKMQIHIKVVHHLVLGYFSILLGWGYFMAWSATYYPQIYRNYVRKSVVGLSFDYIALNLTGHLCYLVFNVSMFYNSIIQKEYMKLHPKGLLPVKKNDVFFSVNAVAMNCVFIIQCFIYERGEQKLSTPMLTLLGGIWITIFSGLFAAISESIGWLQYLYYLSYIKVGTTPIKYTPQVYLHYTKKSTEGWSIYSVLFDVSGGLMSFLQMGLDAVNNDDWDGTLGNPGKLGLSFIAIIYDSIFSIQHFCLYKSGRKRRTTETTEFTQKLNELKEQFIPKKKTARVYDL